MYTLCQAWPAMQWLSAISNSMLACWICSDGKTGIFLWYCWPKCYIIILLTTATDQRSNIAIFAIQTAIARLSFSPREIPFPGLCTENAHSSRLSSYNKVSTRASVEDDNEIIITNQLSSISSILKHHKTVFGLLRQTGRLQPAASRDINIKIAKSAGQILRKMTQPLEVPRLSKYFSLIFHMRSLPL